jgi:hypothetical protein
MLNESLNEFIYLSLELRGRSSDGVMRKHPCESLVRNGIHHECLIAIIDLVETVDKAKKVQKNARVAEDKPVRELRSLKDPLICISLLCEEGLTTDLVAIVVKVEMRVLLKGLEVWHLSLVGQAILCILNRLVQRDRRHALGVILAKVLHGFCWDCRNKKGLHFQFF